MNYYKKIKNMTIEEMAKIITCPDDIDKNHQVNKWCCGEIRPTVEASEEACYQYCLEFLKSEVDSQQDYK